MSAIVNLCFLFSSRGRNSRCSLVTGVQTCALPIFGHPRLRRPDLALGFKVDALRLQRPVIYAGVYIQLGQPLVDMIGPGHAPRSEARSVGNERVRTCSYRWEP